MYRGTFAWASHGYLRARLCTFCGIVFKLFCGVKQLTDNDNTSYRLRIFYIPIFPLPNPQEYITKTQTNLIIVDRLAVRTRGDMPRQQQHHSRGAQV